MAATDEPLPLDYTPAWIALGLVTAADVEHDRLECAIGEDPHPEHYRWRAFHRFLTAQLPLLPRLAHELYALGEVDVDAAMGGTIMAEILRHPDCPLALLHTALLSERPHLRRLAAQRLHPDGQKT